MAFTRRLKGVRDTRQAGHPGRDGRIGLGAAAGRLRGQAGCCAMAAPHELRPTCNDYQESASAAHASCVAQTYALLHGCRRDVLSLPLISFPMPSSGGSPEHVNMCTPDEQAPLYSGGSERISAQARRKNRLLAEGRKLLREGMIGERYRGRGGGDGSHAHEEEQC